ncbi:hypothetical protein [Myroides sp. DF42-4-2]|uniref:hypothetical protein n=1 Tax=Myroides sp. DF42-4-2 TaxID=2746726 RepID=UPI002574E403|nr:hypothetical protein [Myroides sp. DF42-4-2]MDM1409040.1 hypothetical protein [Myroides sp. DF42-4-2]
MLIILNGTITNLNYKINMQEYIIECLYFDKKKPAKIFVWEEEEENPSIIEYKDNTTFQYIGSFKVLHIKYIDDINEIEVSDIRTYEAFCKLVKNLEAKNIRMLIKGCSLQYSMVKALKSTMFTVKLRLGNEINFQKDKVNIFEKEMDVSKIVTLEEQDAFFNKWLDSLN